MPISLEQWRASVGRINASRSCVLMKRSPRTMGAPAECVLSEFLFLLVALASEGLWLFASCLDTFIMKRFRTFSMRELTSSLRQFLFSMIVLVYEGGWFIIEQAHRILSDVLPISSLDLPKKYKHWRTHGGLDQLLCMAFHIVVICSLLYLSGDVETNPGPEPFALIPSNLPQLKRLLNNIKYDWHSIADMLLPKSIECRLRIFPYDQGFDVMLSLWLNGHGFSRPTWRNLWTVIRAAGHASFASRIQQIIDLRGSIMGGQQQQQQQMGLPQLQQPQTIWLGVMEFSEKGQKKQINCQVTTTKSNIIQDLQPQHWPTKMMMFTCPKSIFNSIIKQVTLVTFQFPKENPQSITILRSLMNTECKDVAIVWLICGTQCPIKALILVWSDNQKCFTGVIPLDQTKFMREEILPYMMRMRQQQQHPMGGRMGQGGGTFPGSQPQIMQDEVEMSNFDARKLFSDAMEKGYVTSRSVVIVLVGIAGSGKSSFKRVALNLPLQDKRVSTPLAEAAIRSTSMSRAIIGGDSDKVEWEVVTPERLLIMLADAIKIGVPNQTAEESSKLHTEEHFSSILSPTTNYEKSDSIARSDPDKQLSEPDMNLHDSDDEFELEDDNLLPLISQSKGSKRLFGVHWVYIIDTGGQPQFLQLLPAFVKNISSCVCFAKLNESLDDKPMVAFFDKTGRQYGSSYQSEYSNLQVMESCVRTIHSKSGLLSERSPSFMIVGTHHDEYEQNPLAETLEMKNLRLKTKLGPILKSKLVFHKGDSLIFPLNCKKPENKDQVVISEFRKCVKKYCKEPELQIPLAWFALEQRIRQYATKKNVAYVTRSACSKISKKLNMSDKMFEAALDHLLKLNIFRSYSSLPELIFCDTQVVLLKLTELVQHSFKLQGADVVGPNYQELVFMKKGIINIEFLREFPSFYSDLFTPEKFLDILRELLAIADMKKEEYFMPSLLKELNESEVQSYRCNSKFLSPLLLYLDEGCLPNGLFTSLIAALNNDHNWSPSYINKEPACLYRNCVKLSIPGGVPGSVTLIASFEYIEIHIDCKFESELADICHRVYNDIKNGLEASWKVLYPGDISFKAAFFCSCNATDSKHKSVISSCGKYEMCSVDSSYGVRVTESDIKQHWIQIISKNSPSIPEACADAAGFDLLVSQATIQSIEESSQSRRFGLTSEELQATLHSCVRPYLERQLDWGNEGVEKDLSRIAKPLDNWEEVSPHLELDLTDIHDIKKEYQNEPSLQRRAALRTWKNNCGLQATYKNLLTVFVEAGHSRCAQAVCRVLKKKHPTLCDCSKLPSCEDTPPSKRRKLKN